ncbi:iron ABC transporter permease [Corticibacter populi]|uniref:Iron ABC transporter permease n=2 Tax=Corticibacter populi TaxID=1550736 RepID=A0A3M6QSM4_9BURK|nr:iron ABC transporter permease [Corticibacter populi]
MQPGTPTEARARRQALPPRALAWRRPAWVAAGLAGLLAFIALLHLGVGSRAIALADVAGALYAPDPDNFEHHVIRSLRLPRMLGGLAAGAALGLAGAVVQALTRNPLGEPQLLGLNAGAAFAVVLSTSLALPLLSQPALRPFVAAAGGALLFLVVLLLAQAGRCGMTVLKLTFCGIALSAFVSALSSALLILDEDSLQALRIWLAGDLAEAGAGVVAHAVPAVLAGLLLAAAVARHIDALALGDSMATSLGTPVARTRLAGLAAAALLCGASRRGWLPVSALAGATLVLAADIAARAALAPRELATGVVTAFVGVPVFLALVLRERR